MDNLISLYFWVIPQFPRGRKMLVAPVAVSAKYMIVQLPIIWSQNAKNAIITLKEATGL